MPKNSLDYDLIIFDMDGTLADRDTSHLLSGVRDWFRDVRPSLSAKVVIASNQGGVGLRYWMESGGFGKPEKYPTAKVAENHLFAVMNQCVGPDMECGIDDATLAFAYQSKFSGKWAPTPDIYQKDYHSLYGRWDATFRKPIPGMLLDFMREYNVNPDRTLMVGDSEDDSSAAIAAGCEFIDAAVFFNREPPRPEPRKRPPADSTTVYQGWGKKG